MKKIFEIAIWLLWLAAGIIFSLVSPSAEAWDLEAGYGQTTFSKQANGTWWQDPFANDFQLRHNSYSVGVNSRVGDHLRVRAGYMNLGGVKSSALATASDADYATGHPVWPMSHWYGESKVDGTYLTVNPEASFGSFKMLSEIGLYHYRVDFTMTIPDWRSCQTCAPQYLQVKGDGGTHTTAIVGVGMQYGRMQLMGEYMQLHGGTIYPPNFGAKTYNVSLRCLF